MGEGQHGRSRKRSKRRVSLARSFPVMGHSPGSAGYVRNGNARRQRTANGKGLVKVTDDTTLKLFNLTVQVALSNEQVADDSLSSALLAFRRAANSLAQVEDYLVFNGRGAGQVPAETYAAQARTLPTSANAMLS